MKALQRPEMAAKETVFFIVALCPHESLHTKHTIFLQGCIICRVWVMWSNICPDFFLSVYSNHSVLLFPLCAFLYLDLVSICSWPATFSEAALSTWKPLMEIMSRILMQHLSHLPTYCLHPSFPLFPLCFIRAIWLLKCLCERMTGLIAEVLR